MEGRGRATDNVFIERLWRTVKYEEIYLKEYSSGVETNGRRRFFDYFDFEMIGKTHGPTGNAPGSFGRLRIIADSK